MDKYEAAAMWWAEKLKQKPIYNTRTPLDEKAPFIQSFLDEINPPVTEKQIADFKNVLYFLLETARPYEVHVGYEPDRTLTVAGNAAGVNVKLRFSPKTVMVFDRHDDTVRVREGYDGELIRIYPEGEPDGSGE